MIVVHAGNRIDAPSRREPRFPPSREGHVADRMRVLLDVLQPTGVVTSAAAGADLLLAEAALHQRVPLHVVLPFDRGGFRDTSVSDRGTRWSDAFDRVAAHAAGSAGSSLIELELDAGDAAFREVNGALLERAMTLDQRVLAVVVRPRVQSDPPSVTDDFVERAQAAGLFIIEIDPS